jgi:uncharacterized membrane protein YebE (DUF533 family)
VKHLPMNQFSGNPKNNTMHLLNKAFIAAIASAFAFIPITTQAEDSTMGTAAKGAVVGAVAGAVIGNNTGNHNAGNGAIIGAVVGAGAAVIYHNYNKERAPQQPPQYIPPPVATQPGSCSCNHPPAYTQPTGRIFLPKLTGN